ncbi:glycoside hydrolase family 30 beta sandwich domain-containing protein [Sphingobacterium oryzagri]|uniref:Glycoside hydrolase family 30 beta sandwich domain-containing protein n=1 Tax=Sphingobacterium oryzagri TaxID=3025669 RepID=A0ABY7WEU8_9SPHI|nr:glycoside hydrolase family 30 beta sandwich domain-containing protein [Sphingobacterium sp. KACC 22765]WDF68152.1 glycoside hydrolase family 30 beta sandwich domain-containing protein [Sphingobacterium sp. KACC 22765]
MKNLKKTICFGSLFSMMIVACGSSGKSEAVPQPPAEPQTGDVKIYTTTAARTQEFKLSYVNFGSGVNMSPRTIRLDENVRYQTMDGFGAAITGSTAYNLLKMTQADRTQFLKETFSVSEGMGQSYIRIAIGCSDFSLSEYTLNDQVGIEHFALQEEELNYVIPVLKEILAINPAIKVLGSPWTAPKWMKVNDLTNLAAYDSWTGGHLNPKYYQDYASYFVKWIQAMQQAGIAIHAITPQNEPLNPQNSASMLMYWDEQRDFVRDALGPKLQQAGLHTKIYAFDHNYNYDNMSSQEDYPIKIYDDAKAASYFAGAAYHNYGGDKAELLDVHNKAPEKELIFTETSIGTWNNGQNLGKRLVEDMKEVALGTINHWSRAVIVWNLMLDSERGPNREGGCQTCFGAVDINIADYKTIKKNSHYFIIGHLSAVVKPGAIRIGTSGLTEEGVVVSAFKNPDNSYAVVLANDNNTNKRITFADGKNYFSYEIPAQAVVSYSWK